MVNLHAEVDLRLERRLRRKSLNNRSYKKGPRQQASEKRKCLSVGPKDLEYLTFLDNLKEYRDSYPLVILHENGEVEEIICAALNSLGRESSAMRSEKKRVPENSGGSRKLRSGMVRNCSVGATLNSPGCESSAARSEKKRVLEDSGWSRRLRSGSLRNCSVGMTEERRYKTLNSPGCESSAARSEKKRVFEDSACSRRLRSGSLRNCSVGTTEERRYETLNIRSHESSAVKSEKKQIPEGSGGSRRLRLGVAKERRYETLNSRGRESLAVKSEKKWVPEDSGGLVAKSRKLGQGLVRDSSVGRRADTTRSGFGERDCDRKIIEHYANYADEDYGDILRGKRNGKSVPSSCDDSLHSESTDIGEDYCEFLEYYTTKDEDVMNEQECSDSDSDVVELDVPSAVEIIDMDLEYNPREDLSMRCSEFKKGLLAVLKKPYDSKYHQELQYLVRVRKPVTECKELRGGIKTYPSAHKLADSYLGIYPDFAEVYCRAKEDKVKSLKLLRGFFFYMTKLGSGDVFRPWKYPELFKVTQ